MNSTKNESDLALDNMAVAHSAQTITELQMQRIVQTHDSHGIPLLMGNRAFRRSHIKNRGVGGKPKQYHKQGSK